MPHLWYIADVEAMGKNADKFKLAQISRVDNDSQFIEYCSGIEQFIWGVFLCVDKNFSSQNIHGIEWSGINTIQLEKVCILILTILN